MKTYLGIITEIDFFPMEVIPSWIDLKVYIPDLNAIVQFRETGYKHELSMKFGFEIISGNQWDLSPIKNRKCEIGEKEVGKYSFLYYI